MNDGNRQRMIYDGRCALKIIASKIRKSRAHTPSRTSHMPLAHRIHLLFIAQKPRFALGGVFRLGLDRARGRGFTVMIFILFRGSFEAVFLPYCSSEGPRDYPGCALKDVPPGPTCCRHRLSHVMAYVCQIVVGLL